MGWKFPEIPRPYPVVHLHYLEHFGASVDEYVRMKKDGMKIRGLKSVDKVGDENFA